MLSALPTFPRRLLPPFGSGVLGAVGKFAAGFAVAAPALVSPDGFDREGRILSWEPVANINHMPVPNTKSIIG